MVVLVVVQKQISKSQTVQKPTFPVTEMGMCLIAEECVEHTENLLNR